MTNPETFAPRMTVEEYLAFEMQSEVRHEFINGQIYSMAGGSRAHGSFIVAISSEIFRHLRGKRCQTFTNDVRLNISAISDDYFYYPDILVTFDPRDREHSHFIRYPKLIIEVLSPGTERIDRREKLFAYMQVETLEEYVLIEQDRPEAQIYRPSAKWRCETATGKIELCSIDLSLDLNELLSAAR